MKYLNIRPLMQEFGVHPKKSLGQNFLVEASGLKKVINAADLQPDDQILEIGAGLGGLTYLLAQTVHDLVAVEIDRELIPGLEKAVAEFHNVRIIKGDILGQNIEALGLLPGYKVVANIPYYISSAIIRHLLSAKVRPELLILTVQKEVAERIVARDGKHSLLSLSVHVFGKPELAGVIPAACFLPAPDIDSAVLKITLYPQPIVSDENLDRFFALAKAGFNQKRKTLRNSLSAGLAISNADAECLLKKADLDPQRRAESLMLDEWKKLVDADKSLK